VQLVPIQFLRAFLATRVAAYRQDRGDPEAGFTTVEKVVLTAVAVAAALAVGAIIMARATGKANSIPLN
jgi:hypothetical protein